MYDFGSDARQNEQNGINPSDTSQNDDKDGDITNWGLWPVDTNDPKDVAEAYGHWSTAFGAAAVVLGIGALVFPAAAPVLGPLAIGPASFPGVCRD